MKATVYWLLCLSLMVVPACRGQHRGPGEIKGKAVASEVVARRGERQAGAALRLSSKVPTPALSDGQAPRLQVDSQAIAPGSGESTAAKQAKQILFGDLHVHTTFSADAFLMSLPILQGEGAHPPADACDFARYCSGLDFWSINDHAESLTPRRWRETQEAVRQCNALAGDPSDPDLVTYLGWEWTQVGLTPETHYGHKNVIFRDYLPGEVPTRPIAARGFTSRAMQRNPPFRLRYIMPLLDWPNRSYGRDFIYFGDELRGTPVCDTGVDTRKLPAACLEDAADPAELFAKLDQWGFDTLVIPHGTTWGIYTPGGVSFDKQLIGAQHDPEKQTLIEVYSGHGNSEEYRPWRAVEFDADGKARCPQPSKGYEPCCWRAGEIIRGRCEDPGSVECERLVAGARKNFLDAGVSGTLTVPGSTLDDWGDCGQCTDCFLPAYDYRPGDSVQYAMAISNFDDPGKPRRFRFGFIASSDNHSARPGTGYKEYNRQQMTEAAGAKNEAWYHRMNRSRPPGPESIPFDRDSGEFMPYQIINFERAASFFRTGGLVAVHSPGRDRDSIWDSLKRGEVYGTSGERILLWFDLLNSPAGVVPMGSQVTIGGAPQFRVRAVGSFKQEPGCPEHSLQGLSGERLQRLCRGECYNPGDERKLITRIEVVRIRPQRYEGEDVASLIEDPWKVMECPADPEGCVVSFSDDDPVSAERETIYYVRAIEEPSPAVNAAGFRCDYDEQGRCRNFNPCYGDYRTAYEDDCLSENEERAWSSPIFVSRG